MIKTKRGHTTRQLIINKAAILFTRNGYNHTSLAQILTATGLAKGGFYFHFKSKEELGLAVIESLEAYWRQELFPRMQRGKDAKEKIEIMLSSPGDCYSTPECIRPTILLLTLATEMIEVHDTFSQRLRQIFKEWWATLEEIIDEGKVAGIFKPNVDTHSVAAIILSNIMGANLLALLNGDPGIYDKQLTSLKHALFQGICLNQ
ncbi:MAG: TetR/AcrR family transcriptional regulator [bacterium]